MDLEQYNLSAKYGPDTLLPNDHPDVLACAGDLFRRSQELYFKARPVNNTSGVRDWGNHRTVVEVPSVVLVERGLIDKQVVDATERARTLLAEPQTPFNRVLITGQPFDDLFEKRGDYPWSDILSAVILSERYRQSVGVPVRSDLVYALTGREVPEGGSTLVAEVYVRGGVMFRQERDQRGAPLGRVVIQPETRRSHIHLTAGTDGKKVEVRWPDKGDMQITQNTDLSYPAGTWDALRTILFFPQVKVYSESK